MSDQPTTTNVLNVSDYVDTAPLNFFHILIMILCAAIMVMDGFDLIAMGMVVPIMSESWDMPLASFSENLVSPVSAVLFGVVVGSIGAGWLADKYGRRPVVLVMVVLAAIFMGLTVMANSINELIVYRFFTGIGAGGSIPIAIAMAAEFAPAKHRSLMVMIMYTGAPLGASLGGIIGPKLINNYGWQGIFYFGCLTQLLVAVLLLLLLPESVKFMARVPGKTQAVLGVLRRIRHDKTLQNVTEFTFNEVKQVKSSLKALFIDDRAKLTFSLWVIFFGMQFVLFYISLMMPAFLKSAGWSATEALRPLGFYNLGAFFGGVAIGLLANRIGPAKSLLITLPLSALLLILLGFLVAPTPTSIFFQVALLAGAITIGNGMALAPLASEIYPTQARSTGIGAALGVGRGGSIIAPFIGAMGLKAALTAQGFFFAAAFAPIVCFASLLLLIYFRRNKPPQNNL